MKSKKKLIAWIALICLSGACMRQERSGCLTGAFLDDRPSPDAITRFQEDYGKKPFFVLVFLDWGSYPDEKMVRDVYGAGSVLMITWEPWRAVQKEGIDYDALLRGEDDAYLREFAAKLKVIEKPVFLRFAHEMNGDWYPWAGDKITPEKYKKIFWHIRKIFDQVQAINVRWVFSVNAENVPTENKFDLCYPGDQFVDYIGVDGYNWGVTQLWSRWQSFKEIFSGVYEEITRRYPKPVLITEFGSTSAGGDKVRWILEAFQEIRKMPKVRGFVLFNVDKETDWRVAPENADGKQLKESLASPYFMEKPEGPLRGLDT